MNAQIEYSDEIGNGRWKTLFNDGQRRLLVIYTYLACGWTMNIPNSILCVDDIPLLEAAIHELRRLNGTLPPKRIGGLRPAKGGK